MTTLKAIIQNADVSVCEMKDLCEYFLGLNLLIFFENNFCLQSKLFMLMAVVWL